MIGREYLLDVSRLIWRTWNGRLPTGIDRVCLEYVEHFGSRSQAVLQFKGGVFVLPPAASDRLFDLFRGPSAGFQRRLIALLASALWKSSRSPPRPEMIYLNVGHTGLDQPGLVNWVRRRRVRAVYLMHDLIPITHPEFCRPGEAVKHRLRTHNVLVSAAGIVCNSEVTRTALREVAEVSGLAMPCSVVAWISGPTFRKSRSPKILERPYFVVLGTIEARKNHLLLMKVWQSLTIKMRSRAPLLVIIGQRGWEAEDVNSILDNLQELQEHVYELPSCDDEDLARWLAGARALLMPSFVEGFGLPVVEALQMQVPVIASSLPVYREVVGNIPIYLDPCDPSAWERTIEDFLTDAPERLRQIREARNFRAPNWASHFATVEDWLQQLY